MSDALDKYKETLMKEYALSEKPDVTFLPAGAFNQIKDKQMFSAVALHALIMSGDATLAWGDGDTAMVRVSDKAKRYGKLMVEE